MWKLKEVYMHAIIDDFAWIFIGLAVISVFFIIGLAFIFLDEGLRILFRKARHLQADTSAPSQAAAISLPSGPRLLRNPATEAGGGKQVSASSFPQIISAAWRVLHAKLRSAANETHMPFRWGHR